MGMSQSYGKGDDEESMRTLHRALDLGINLIDTADAYAKGANETLVGQAVRARRSEVVLASKFGLVPPPAGGPEVTRRSLIAGAAALGAAGAMPAAADAASRHTRKHRTRRGPKVG